MPIKKLTDSDLKLLAALSIGSRINHLRKLLHHLHGGGYTVTDVARRIGITYQSLSAIEKNTVANPSFKIIHNLSKDFHVPIEIFTDEYYVNNPEPFTIGSGEENKSLETLKSEEPTDQSSKRFKFGALHYQINEKNELFFTHDIQTKTPIDINNMIQIIARYDFEHKLINTISDIGNPQFLKKRGRSYNEVLLQYYRALDDPRFPRVISKEKEHLILKYLDTNPLKETKNEDTPSNKDS